MSKPHADNTSDENAPERRQLSADEVLVEAARNGDTAAVRAGLEKLFPDKDCQTLVFDAAHEACRGNHDECLALLLPYVDTTQVGFGILLSECVHADHVACTEVLLQHWKSVCSNVAFVPLEHNDGKGGTPFSCPAMWEDPAVCQVFVDSGADVETRNEEGDEPLYFATMSGEGANVKLLVEAGAGVSVTDNQGWTCLILAAYYGYSDIVRYLVGLPQVEVNFANQEGSTALHCALQHRHTDVVRALIDAGADIEAKDRCTERSPLLKASISGNAANVNLLVRAGASVHVTDVTGRTGLIHASALGHTDTVRTLLCMPEVEVDKAESSTGCTALHHAVNSKRAEVLEVLIDAGADIEAKDDMGHSPLHSACHQGELAIVKMLVRAGAGVSVTDNEGDTCLIFAACAGCTRTVRYLVGFPEVDVNHQGSNNLTALQRAADESHPNVMRVLIDAGADLESIDDDMPPSPGSVSGD